MQEDVLKQKQTDVSPALLGLDGKKEAWASGYTGKGVVVGVIDSGIWPEHPSFADNGLAKPSGFNADVPCQFGDTAYNPDDAPFECQDKLLGARAVLDTYDLSIRLGINPPELYKGARDSDGHGTHTASTAAGNRDVDAEIFGIDRGTVSGIAPEASIIAYKGLGDGGGYTSDLAKAIDLAVADGVDVINYSVGSSDPSIGGADDIAFLFAANAGVFVATSNGNGGPRASTTGSPANVPWLTAVGASTHDRTFENMITLGNGKTYVGTSITEGLETTTFIDAADRGNPLCLDNVEFTPALDGEIVLCERGTNARVDKSKAVFHQGGGGMILFNNNDAQALITDSHWLPSSHVRNTPGLEMKAYIDEAGDAATAAMTQGEKTATQPNVMADFSSRGPVGFPGDPNIIRPDVTAPGVNILAGNTPTPSTGRPGQLFQSISGTSMSSPHVAGLFALLKQAHPDWSSAVAKSALMTTARQDVVKEDGKTPADPFDFGAGHVDPGQPGKRGSIFDPGIAFDADLYNYAAYSCGQDAGIFTPGSCEFLEANGYSLDSSELNVPSIGIAEIAGPRTVTRTITNVSGQPVNMQATVQAPEGFSVSVSPERVKLKAGEEADVTITVTNRSAPVGEWRFGAVTWTGTGYDARIPLAVAGTPLKAPAEVTGSGASGAGSVTVDFGYTGQFHADAYGLAKDTPLAGEVTQDRTPPDALPVFDVSDLGNGATLHEVDLTGVELWRLTLGAGDISGGGGTDLDIFVYGPDGERVAQSTNEGTDEIIQLDDPAPGVYSVYVHGWATDAPVIEYAAHTWSVGAADDSDTLLVTSAPTEAVVGTSGIVEYSWTAAEPGTELGMLVFTDGSNEIGRTLVTVTN